MNELVYASLAKKAGSMMPKDKLIPYDYQLYMKILTELVVQECATIAYQWQDEYGIIDDYYTPPTIDNVIKQHFGVEE